MGFVVLWIESFVVAMLLTALVIACVGRLQGRWRRRVWGIVAVAPLLAVYAAPASLAGWFEFEKRLYVGLFWPLLLLFGCFLIGVVVIWRGGMRIEQPGDAAQAAKWPRGKLALALLAALVLHMMTFSNLDSAARNSLAAVQADSAALAASVAPAHVPDHENAALVYQQAFDAFGPKKDWPPVWNEGVEALHPQAPAADDAANAAAGGEHKPAEPFDFGSDALGEFLKEHAGELQLLRTAAAMPECYFDKNYARLSFEIMLPEIQHMRTGSWLLALDARHRAAKGDLEGALTDINAQYQMAAHAGTEPFLVSMLVAAAIDRRAGETLQAVLGSGVAGGGKLDAISIDGTPSYRRLLERALRMEEAFITSYFGGMARIDTTDEMDEVLNFNRETMPLFAPIYRVFLQPYDLAQYRRFAHAHEQLFGKPYQEARNHWQSEQNEFDRQPRGLLTALFTPALGAASDAAFGADARRKVAETALGMHRYAVEHGKFPERLDELVPQHLAVVPRDPFDDRPLKLAKTPQGWVVYSIGRDLVDDGGKPFDENHFEGDLTFEYAEPATHSLSQ